MNSCGWTLGPQPLELFGKVVEPLEGGALLENVGSLGVYSSVSFSIHSLLPDCECNGISWPPAPANLSFLQWWTGSSETVGFSSLPLSCFLPNIQYKNKKSKQHTFLILKYQWCEHLTDFLEIETWKKILRDYILWNSCVSHHKVRDQSYRTRTEDPIKM